jgi:hypothetical protein
LEGDIRSCFDSLDHTILEAILAEHIHDNRFLRLLHELLKAGYLEHWTYHATLSGAPQGSLIGPILSNIYLTRLDQYVETVLIPQYTRGNRRRLNLAYEKLSHRAKYLARVGRTAQAVKLPVSAYRACGQLSSRRFLVRGVMLCRFLSAQERVPVIFSAPGRKRLTHRTLMLVAACVASMACA